MITGISRLECELGSLRGSHLLLPPLIHASEIYASLGNLYRIWGSRCVDLNTDSAKCRKEVCDPPSVSAPDSLIGWLLTSG